MPELRRDGYQVTFVTYDGSHHLERWVARRGLSSFLSG
jgi:hypothetical protein